MKLNLKSKQLIDTYLGIPLIFLNRIIAIIFGALLRRNHSVKNKTPDHIIIIKMLGFGSVILASDSILAIRKKYPLAQLHIVCSESIAEGIASLQLFDSILIINDTSFWDVIISSFKNLRVIWRKSNRWIIDLEVYSKLTSLFSLWTMSYNRVGFYFNDVAFRYRLNTHNVYFNNVVNVEENYKRMAEALDAEVDEIFKLPGFAPRSNTNQYEFVSINNTCSELSPERKLTPVQLKFICEWILLNTSFSIALMGTKDDYEVHEDFIQTNFSNNSQRIYNYCGKFNLPEYFHFLYNNSKILMTIDSAPLHIANKLNVPNISFWGPTSPESRIYNSAMNEFIYMSVSCSPCAHQTDVLPCGGNNFCISTISNQNIVESMQRMLK
jgi:ADP-heptose:LPS heptosyltransferase